MAKTTEYRVIRGTFEDLLSVNAGLSVRDTLETLTTVQNSVTHSLCGLAMFLENEPDHLDSRLLWSLSYLSELCEAIGQACVHAEGV